MARIPGGFDDSASPYIQFGKRTLYLDGGDIEIDGHHIGALRAQELMLVLHLLEKASTSSHGYLPTWYLAREIYPNYYYMEKPEHAIEEHISNIRRKLGESGYRQRYIIGRRNKGYKLCISNGGCNVSLQLIQKLLNSLRKR